MFVVIEQQDGSVIIVSKEKYAKAIIEFEIDIEECDITETDEVTFSSQIHVRNYA